MLPNKNGKAKYKFIDYGKAVLRVTAENGLSACDTITVVLCPEGMVGVREGPFFAQPKAMANATTSGTKMYRGFMRLGLA